MDLAATFLKFIEVMNPSHKAIYTYRKVQDILNNLKVDMIRYSGDVEEIKRYEYTAIKTAADLLHVLDVEQYRQRASIKMFLAGRLSRAELGRIAETWNNETGAQTASDLEKVVAEEMGR